MRQGPVQLKSGDDIRRIEESGHIISELFAYLGGMSLVSASTWEIDTEIERFIGRKKGRAAFKTLRGYNYASCISINDEVVHGIPSRKKRVREGDLIKIDVGVVYNGYFSDACITLAAGRAEDPAGELLRSCMDILAGAIAVMGPGVPLGQIGNIIEENAGAGGYSIVRSHTGHGVGFALHEPPVVPHFRNSGQNMLLREGMVLTVEPVLCMGSGDVRHHPNGWSTCTADGSLAAQFEHTIAIVENGARILTA
jgi:methionyl aminopeptidase